MCFSRFVSAVFFCYWCCFYCFFLSFFLSCKSFAKTINKPYEHFHDLTIMWMGNWQTFFQELIWQLMIINQFTSTPVPRQVIMCISGLCAREFHLNFYLSVLAVFKICNLMDKFHSLSNVYAVQFVFIELLFGLFSPLNRVLPCRK